MSANIRKKIGTGIMAVLLAAAIVPSIAEARRGNCNKGGGQGMSMNCDMKGGRGGAAFGIWQNPQAVQDLGLSADQVKKLKEAEFASREKQLPLMGELDGLRLKMDQAFAADPVDEKAVLELTEKISAVKGKLSVQRAEDKLALSKVLTPEQMDKMQTMRGMGCNGKNGSKPCAMNGQGNGGGKPCQMNGKGGRGMGMGAGNAQN
uniref:Spy/CpxP family protein refolding chaperone n=1 Tax=Candidatus Electronema sp. TaxID=2698783 RepID=UPI004056BA4F